MNDFIKVFGLLILVFGSMAGFYYLAFVLGIFGMALLEIVVATVIIMLFIRYFRRRP